MICAWKELLGILPQWLRPEVDRLGKTEMEELRLRINAPPELILKGKSCRISGNVSREDLNFTVNHASSFSPWAASSIARGYLTATGGHRIGICGEVVYKDGQVTGVREISSLCVRVARDFQNIGGDIQYAKGSVIILGAPGWGKTTLLRDMIRKLSELSQIAVVDERRELFPKDFDRGLRVDVLSGCPKPQGMDMVLRTMSPGWIAVDEITSPEDCSSILQCFGCGVPMIATAHASSLEDFYRRRVYQPLLQAGVFETGFLLRPDKSFRMERIAL